MKFKRKNYNIRLVILIIIIVGTAMWNVVIIGNVVTSKVTKITFEILERNLYSNIHEVFTGQVITNDELRNIVKIKLNDKNEIIYIDYDYGYINEYLKEQLASLFMKLESASLNNQYYDEKLNILIVPIGISTDNLLLSNMGPKIPCKLNVLNNIDISLKTRIKDYGINNSLIEIYALINIKSTVINPVIEDKLVKEYEILIDSKVIEGKIPSYYGGVIEKSSSIVSS